MVIKIGKEAPAADQRLLIEVALALSHCAMVNAKVCVRLSRTSVF
jgi:hypothetical protein